MAESPFTLRKMRQDALAIFNDALKAVAPAQCIRNHLRLRGNLLLADDQEIDLSRIRRIYVLGAGKATAAMALEIEAMLQDRVTAGLICVKYGHTAPLGVTETIEAGHPVPDAAGMDAAGKILAMASKAGPEDLIIFLVSGGGSALLSLPAPGLTLTDKQATTRALLACGAGIHEINSIRKHLSAIKGGQLARAASPARLLTLVLSDVVGDDLDVIASGPTVPDPSTFVHCLDIIRNYHLEPLLPEKVLSHLELGASGQIPETPKPGEAPFQFTSTVIVGSNQKALLAARESAREKGYHPLILSSRIEGETREVARVHTAIAAEAMDTGNPVRPPACILSGGETTVTIHGAGKGGRNQEFALAAALELHGMKDVVVFSAGTDGTDGPTDAAGAVADPRTVSRAEMMGENPRSYLEDNDAYHFFEKLGDLIITGPTHTNVMDLRIVLIAKSGKPLVKVSRIDDKGDVPEKQL